MRQKTKNLQNQGSIDKIIDFFPIPKSHTQMGSFRDKTLAKNSHAWAPLSQFRVYSVCAEILYPS
jgi:hypothetical protein